MKDTAPRRSTQNPQNRRDICGSANFCVLCVFGGGPLSSSPSAAGLTPVADTPGGARGRRCSWRSAVSARRQRSAAGRAGRISRGRSGPIGRGRQESWAKFLASQSRQRHAKIDLQARRCPNCRVPALAIYLNGEPPLSQDSRLVVGVCHGGGGVLQRADDAVRALGNARSQGRRSPSTSRATPKGDGCCFCPRGREQPSGSTSVRSIRPDGIKVTVGLLRRAHRCRAGWCGSPTRDDDLRRRRAELRSWLRQRRHAEGVAPTDAGRISITDEMDRSRDAQHDALLAGLK